MTCLVDPPAVRNRSSPVPPHLFQSGPVLGSGWRLAADHVLLRGPQTADARAAAGHDRTGGRWTCRPSTAGPRKLDGQTQPCRSRPHPAHRRVAGRPSQHPDLMEIVLFNLAKPNGDKRSVWLEIQRDAMKQPSIPACPPRSSICEPPNGSSTWWPSLVREVTRTSSVRSLRDHPLGAKAITIADMARKIM
jgi:hypothetical protein